MTLMFPRLANNAAKNGYYPTDEATLAAICESLDVNETTRAVRLLDPCCGDGYALASLQHYFLHEQAVEVDAYGIELNAERAYQAKAMLTMVAHSDVNDVVIAPRSVGCLFLNPPYGDLMSDRAGLIDAKSGRQRLEKMFFDQTVNWLQYEGVLVLIVPSYCIDADFASRLARHFDRLSWYLAPEQQFKQAVIFGVRTKGGSAEAKQVVDRLVAFGQGHDTTSYAAWRQVRYVVPAPPATTVNMRTLKIDRVQLANELTGLLADTMWGQFSFHFSNQVRSKRQWLCEPSPWHLALALAAGQVCGLVTARDGRKLLVKGDTRKEKETIVEVDEDEDGNTSEKRVLVDKFVPVISGIDVTRDRASFGAVVSVR
jgi:hypothetical protein